MFSSECKIPWTTSLFSALSANAIFEFLDFYSYILDVDLVRKWQPIYNSIVKVQISLPSLKTIHTVN